MGKSMWKNRTEKIEKTGDIKINRRYGSFSRRTIRRNLFHKMQRTKYLKIVVKHKTKSINQISANWEIREQGGYERRQKTRKIRYTVLWIREILARIWIRASDQWVRIRILLFSILTFKTPTKNDFFLIFSAYYFGMVHLHHSSKIKIHKEVTKR